MLDEQEASLHPLVARPALGTAGDVPGADESVQTPEIRSGAAGGGASKPSVLASLSSDMVFSFVSGPLGIEVAAR